MLFPLHRTSSCRVPFPRRVRDGDPHGRRLRHGGSVALGGSAALVQYSPARRTYFVRYDRVAGTRPVPETLYYEDCGGAGCTPQYNGNVSRMAHSLAHGNSAYGQERDVSYAYDLMNRLTNVDDADIDGFDETFAYDPQGRITAQRRGADAANAAGGEYDYYANTDKLKKAAAGMSAAVDAERLMNADSNFVYDADGNMTYDASKKMTVTYDWRGLPAEFRGEVTSASGVAGAVDSVRLLMTYDGSGSRIGKRYERKDAGDTAWTLQLATHYTGIGSEIRVSGLDGTAKVVVNMPQGLGRYAVASASGPSTNSAPSFEWYLKNHLGSTMLVYGTGSGSGSVQAAYDYRAFGEQVDLTVPADKVTENFTGKENDEETDLNYFGARYLDPMLGLWVSADPKRQFASPYLYAGNGVNPVRFFDPSGFAMYQLAIYANGLSEKDRYDVNAVISRLQRLEGFDVEDKYVDSQKELAEFTNRGTYTAVLAHGNYRESAFSQTKDFNGKIEYSDFDKKVLSGSFAKFFTCFSATIDDSRLEHVSTERGVLVTDQLGVVYDRYQNTVSLGDAAKDAGTYLLNTYKDDLDSQK